MPAADPSLAAPAITLHPRYLRLRRWLLAAYWLALFVVMHVPRVPQPPRIPHIDKLAHAVAYALLGVLLMGANRRGWGAARLDYLRGFGILAGYAVLDELLQIPVGRTADWRDVLADLAGVLCGFGLFALAARLRRNARSIG